jgi:Na+/H+ antiporter NhaD/arsenite permease-like protein
MSICGISYRHLGSPMRLVALSVLVLLFLSNIARASGTNELDGELFGLVWIIPFMGILLSIALFPLLASRFWHQHYGKVALFWALAFVVPFFARFGSGPTIDALLQVAFLEYIPFIILIGALFAISGGIYVSGNLHGSPKVNTALLAIGALLASVVGTTGASMILIRPLLRANDDRGHNTHAVIFFIFLVSNIGGSLTPLGDPPLFLGFLKGVAFFWPLRAMWLPTLITGIILLLVFYVVDSYIYRKEGHKPRDPSPDKPIRISGMAGIVLLILLIGTVLLTSQLFGLGTIPVRSIDVPLSGIIRDGVLILLAAASFLLCPSTNREANRFSWEPVLEVAKLFAGIFITIVPAIAILGDGRQGAAAPLIDLLTNADQTPNNMMYFWLTGILSSFLDNAPTYLIFFNSAGGNPLSLQDLFPTTLLAISAGAVFMGANTYIGNAPNFMVKSIAERHGVPMPSFFGYMAWSGAYLLPVFAIITLIFFR